MLNLDWQVIGDDLHARGCALIERLLAPADCRAVADLYPDDRRFRSRVVMERHGFGRGEYRYFAYPLPTIVAALLAAFYPQLVPIANQRPRMQSRAEVGPLQQGDAVIFVVHHLPVQGTRGAYRVNLRHGVSRVRAGRAACRLFPFAVYFRLGILACA